MVSKNLQRISITGPNLKCDKCQGELLIGQGAIKKYRMGRPAVFYHNNRVCKPTDKAAF